MDPRDGMQLTPDMTTNELREEARVFCWDAKLRGIDEQTTAKLLNEKYELHDPKKSYKARDVARLLDRTLRSRRVLHSQDAGERLLVAEGRMEEVLRQTWVEIDFERELRRRWLAGEFDPKVDLLPVGEDMDPREAERNRKTNARAMMSMMSSFGGGRGKDPKFSIPKLLDIAANTIKELARMQGVSAPDAVNHITVNSNQMTVMAEELLGDPRTRGIAEEVLKQLALAARSTDDDLGGDAGASGLGPEPEAGYIDAEYISADDPAEPLAERPEDIPDGVFRDDPDPGPEDDM